MTRCLQPPKCQYNQNKCVKPNAWIEHLVFWGGRGLTRTQMSEKYRTEPASARAVCRRVRNRGRDRKLDAEVVAKDLSAYLEDANHPNINMAVLRRRVVREMSKRSNRHRLATNFDASRLDKKHLIKLADIIDSVFWNGTLMDALNKRISHGVLEFKVEHDESARWEGITDTWHNEDDNSLQLCEIIINTAKFSGQSTTRRSSGILAANKLDALSITMQHELMHALANASNPNVVDAQGLDGHGLMWRQAWHNFHGGSLHTYKYTDSTEYIDLR